MGKENKLTAEQLKMVTKATKCPKDLIKGEGEQSFLAETKERLEQYGSSILLSEKQLAWLTKISQRVVGQKRAEKSVEANHFCEAGAVGIAPDFDELSGE